MKIKNNTTQAVILCGGKGTRFKKISHKPKILAKLGNTTLVDIILEKLKKNKIHKYLFLLGHKGGQIIHYLKKKNYNFEYIKEKQPLGTAGCLFQINTSSKYLIIIMGDLLFDINIKNFLNFHKKKKSDISFAVHPNNHPWDSDLIKIDQNNRVKNIFFKNRKNTIYNKNLVMSGIYIINTKLLNHIKKNKFQDLTKNFIFPLLKKKRVFAYTTHEYTKDIGTPKRYKEAQKDFKNFFVKKNKFKSAIFLDRDGVINFEKNNFLYSDPTNFLPGAINAIKKINQNKYLVILITNQPAIAKGFVSKEQVEKSHDKMETLLGNKGAFVNGIYYCPHHPEKGFKGEIKSLKISCKCRKPKPGLINLAVKEFKILKKKSIFIGNSYTDYLAAKNANIKFFAVNNNKISKDHKHIVSYKSLIEFANSYFKKKNK